MRDPEDGEAFLGFGDQDVAGSKTAGAAAVAAVLEVSGCGFGTLDGFEADLSLALAVGGGKKAGGGVPPVIGFGTSR